MEIQSFHTDITDSILGCAIAVHKELGPALAEHSYQTALALEMRAGALGFVSGKPIVVRYRGVVVGWHTPDFRVGLLLNFNVASLGASGIKRLQL